METRIAASCLLAALAIAMTTAALGQATSGPDAYVGGRVLVQARPGLPVDELDRILKAHGGRRAQTIKRINVHIVELPPQANVVAVVQALRKNRHLRFAELDGIVQPAFYPNDPYYSNAWHLPRIQAGAAWDRAQGDGITIAILDSGADTAHPDLQPQLLPGWNHFDNNSDVSDVSGHGTAVAGIAAAAGNNGVGVTSVGMRSKLMPLRVTDTTGNGYYSLMAAALVTAADSGARVANISFLGVSTSSSVDSAAQYFRSKGGVVVVSGGNTGDLRADPPRASLTVVAATDTADRRASFSSWGDYIDIAAPGVSLVTTLRGSSYGGLGGTSASAPVVAGVYALMMSAKPGLSPAALDEILFSSAVDLGAAGWDPEYGYGRVDAAAAVSKASQTFATDSAPPTVAITSPTGGTASGLVPVDVSASDDTGVTRVELYANNALVASDTTSPYGFTVDASQYADGQLTLVAKAYDAANNAGESAPVTLSVANDSVPPTVMILSPSNGSTVSGTVTVSVSALDNVKVAKVSLSIDGSEVAVSYGSSLKYSWSVPAAKGKGRGKSGAPSSLTARATDGAGNVATASITVTRN